jgi:hypothetical protein
MRGVSQNIPGEQTKVEGADLLGHLLALLF